MLRLLRVRPVPSHHFYQLRLIALQAVFAVACTQPLCEKCIDQVKQSTASKETQP